MRMNEMTEASSMLTVGDVAPTYDPCESASLVGRGYVPDGRQ
jgi:hypothetical protein